MTREEAKQFGLNLLKGIMERNESYPIYANNVKQAIDALSVSEPEGLDEAAEKYRRDSCNASMRPNIDGPATEYEGNVKSAFKAGAEWAFGQGESINTKIGLATEEIFCHITEDALNRLGVGVDDEVIVQIRKK